MSTNQGFCYKYKQHITCIRVYMCNNNHVTMYMYTVLCVYVCIHMYIYTYVCVFDHMHLCIYVYIHVYVYIYIHEYSCAPV